MMPDESVILALCLVIGVLACVAFVYSLLYFRERRRLHKLEQELAAMKSLVKKTMDDLHDTEKGLGNAQNARDTARKERDEFVLDVQRDVMKLAEKYGSFPQDEFGRPMTQPRAQLTPEKYKEFVKWCNRKKEDIP
jgi:septal ring factor EnvC (AmiA/AmiB activator)